MGVKIVKYNACTNFIRFHYRHPNMKTDALKQYIHLREALLKEKSSLEARLAQIHKALGGGGSSVTKAAAPKPAVAAKGPNRKRAKNKLSLKDAVSHAIEGKELTKPEILDAIKATGYKFATKDPINSLNALLYSGKVFKKVGDGKFGLAK